MSVEQTKMPSQSEQTTATTTRFKGGDIVWAKYEEYSHWPGRIASEHIAEAYLSHKDVDVSDSSYCVLFYGKELTYGLVEADMVEDYRGGYRRHKDNYDDADFKEAMRMAALKEQFVDPPLEIQTVIVPTKEIVREAEPRTEKIKEYDGQEEESERSNKSNKVELKEK